MNKFVCVLLAAAAAAASTLPAANAAAVDSAYIDPVSGIRFSTFDVVSGQQGVQDAAVPYTDPQRIPKDSSLQNKHSSFSPADQISEVYSHSVYSNAGTSVTRLNTGPRQNDIFLGSSARGSSFTLTGRKQISASKQISGLYNSGIASLVKRAVAGNISGEFHYVWPDSKVYTAPETVPFHRDYYGAIQYDTCSTLVRQKDIYKQYYRSIYVREVQYERGIVETVSSIAPKGIEYSIDF
ncbi:hypothetical protein [Paenibacillus sp. UNC499MF]|uniref:hypothetical protein n=1 Tax=Paenibacillus sp. UNC499MF TaxID=1502751 RepID=UPI0008A0462D|nr:hypothetical protein [Paenibacillus sp. UNC499MF]SEG06298.1 hypothetical protein SAMN02799616_01714 [Paenibacillus sp. UNC499MF]